MRLILVRHGHAGRKDQWHRADRVRPLDPRGLRQATRLADVLAPLKPTRIVSSGHVRCLQTMEPLALRTSLEVERSKELMPHSPLKALALVRELSAPSARGVVVVCTHGEVIGTVLNELASQDGLQLDHRPPGLKGCSWVLETRRGEVVSARYIAPDARTRKTRGT